MYIQFTKDINKIRNRIIFGLGFREIVIFLLILGIGLAVFFGLKNVLPNDIVYYMLVPIVLIGMFFMVFKHNGMPFEKFLFYKIKRLIFSAKVKRYVTENGLKESAIIKSKNHKLILGTAGTGKAFKANFNKLDKEVIAKNGTIQQKNKNTKTGKSEKNKKRTA